MPLVIADAFAQAAGRAVHHPGQQPQDPRGLLHRHRPDRHPGHPAGHRQAGQGRARTRSRAMLVESGATTRAGRPVPGPRRDPHERPRLRRRGSAPWAWSNPTLDEGLAALEAVISAGHGAARPGMLVADLRIARGLDYYTGTVYETQLVGYESWGSFCSGGRYDALASDGRTTYPGVGISIGLSRHPRAAARQGARRPRAAARRPAVLVAVDSEAGRRPVAGRRHRVAGPRHPVRGRPLGERSSASRSGMPSGGACRSCGSRGPATMGPTRSRTSARASRSPPTPASWSAAGRADRRRRSQPPSRPHGHRCSAARGTDAAPRRSEGSASSLRPQAAGAQLQQGQLADDVES